MLAPLSYIPQLFELYELTAINNPKYGQYRSCCAVHSFSRKLCRPSLHREDLNPWPSNSEVEGVTTGNTSFFLLSLALPRLCSTNPSPHPLAQTTYLNFTALVLVLTNTAWTWFYTSTEMQGNTIYWFEFHCLFLSSYNFMDGEKPLALNRFQTRPIR